MRVLVVGASGMLGHAVYGSFVGDSTLETWGTLRDVAGVRHFPEAQRSHLLTGVDANNWDALVGALSTVRPDVVINAVGVVKQLAAATDPVTALPVNAIFPHRLARLCGIAGARLVHISTDCVFSGKKGAYSERDESDATDLYGKSKYIGEVVDQSHTITLRTSGIGHELASQNGLIEWFLHSQGPVRGFSRAVYSGLPWIELARVMRDFVLPNPALHGLYHVSSDALSKLDLLTLVGKTYGRSTEIVPDDSVTIDRSLDSSRFRAATGYVPESWPNLIRAMHADYLATRHAY